MKLQRKLICLLTCACLIIPLTGCAGNDGPTITPDGGMLFLDRPTMEQEGRTGFYVLNEDDTFTPVMNAAQGYEQQNDIEESKGVSNRFLWFTNNEINISELIPTVTAKTPLVFIYDLDEDLPSVYTLEKYAYKGYTIGCHIYRDADDTLIIDTEDTLPGSAAGEAMTEFEAQERYTISQINGSENLPIKNVDNNIRMLLGLEKDKYYNLEFYKGTKYETLITVADTLVLQAESITILRNPYTRTMDGYFVINLPENLQPGYYYVCGAGLFRYVK